MLDKLEQRLKENTENFLGYPVSKDFDIDPLIPFLKYPINNLGDPFEEGCYGVHTREMEREVVEFFANLFNAPTNNWSGYVTNGGSEGNLYALYLARERFPNAMVYYSESTHYSVQKNIHLLNLPSITIKAQDNGEIDYNDLKQTIGLHRNVPAIIVANIGTTMTEAKDDVKLIKQILRETAVRNHYIHSDAALSGIPSAFCEPKPNFDFADGADSIAISGHKFIGSPIPCGVVVVKKNNKDRISLAVSYIGSNDTTITGSRNGHSPLFIWHALKQLGRDGLKKRVDGCLAMAAYTEKKLKALGINAWRNPNAITVVIPQQSEELTNKWQLASEDGMTHIICMPNVTTKQIDAFLADLLIAQQTQIAQQVSEFQLS